MGVKQESFSDQFDDIIMDPESADGGDLDQDNQGYESDTSGAKVQDVDSVNSGERDPKSEELKDGELETFDNIGKSQINQLEEKEDKGESEKKEEDEQKGEKNSKESKDGEGDSKSDDDKTPEDNKDEEAPKGEVLKLFKDKSKYEVPKDATVKVKVDGRSEKVTIDELRSAYSGQKSWDKKFTEITETKKELEQREYQVGKVQETLKTTIDDVRTSLSEAISLGKDPMSAVDKIVDLIGVDSYDFNRALFDSLHEKLVTLDEMDEFERKAHWLEQKTEHLQKKSESFSENVRQTQAQEERLNNINRIREAQGVSEEDFVSAYKQLSQTREDVTPEQVVDYAATLPHLQVAEDLLSKYEDQLDDTEFEDYMARVAHTLKTNKQVSKEDVETYLAEMFEVDNAVNSANAKADKLEVDRKDLGSDETNLSQKDLYSKASYEAFDDFDL